MFFPYAFLSNLSVDSPRKIITSISSASPSRMEKALASSKFQTSNIINVFPYSSLHTPSVISTYPANTTTTAIPNKSSIPNKS